MNTINSSSQEQALKKLPETLPQTLPEALPETLLELQDLEVFFDTHEGSVPAVHKVSFSLAKGRTLCLVGESGCGKSATAHSILRLLPEPPARMAKGKILFAGQDILTLSPNELRKIRGAQIGMIFQDPMSSLNPVLTIGEQIVETLELHLKMSAQDAKQRAIELLTEVGISEAAKRFSAYPHELSGGMRQRVMIAIAIACKPQLIIADEPTTALDVTMQKQILTLLKQLIATHNCALLLITHDLGVVAAMADDVIVMYAGEIVEYAKVKDLFHAPAHPYTKGLLLSRPAIIESPIDKALLMATQRNNATNDNSASAIPTGALPTGLLPENTQNKKKRLPTIIGAVPSLLKLPQGCYFHPRCPEVFEKCKTQTPSLFKLAHTEGRFSRCWLCES